MNSLQSPAVWILPSPVLGLPAMKNVQKSIGNSSDLMVIEDGGHFLQEWGGPIAEAAVHYFKS